MTIEMDNYQYINVHQELSRRELRYNKLKECFLQHSVQHVSSDTIEQLKEFYKEIIGSKREKDGVKNLKELLRILEKRDALQYNMIEPLKYISKEHIKDHNLNQEIIQYEIEVKEENSLPLINFYKYSGEYICMSNDNECLLFNWENGNPCDDLIMNLQTEETISPQSKKPPHQRSKYFSSNFNKCSFKCFIRKNYKCQCIIIIAFLLIVLVVSPAIIVIMYVHHNPTIKSSAPDRDIPNNDSPSHTHTVNFHPVQPTSSAAAYEFNFLPSTSNELPTNMQKKVFTIISQGIGRYWRDLARFLEVKESEIDAIEQRDDLKLDAKASEALSIFQSRCDPCSNWKIKIQKALEKARRKDLAEMIKDIYLSENS